MGECGAVTVRTYFYSPIFLFWFFGIFQRVLGFSMGHNSFVESHDEDVFHQTLSSDISAFTNNR